MGLSPVLNLGLRLSPKVMMMARVRASNQVEVRIRFRVIVSICGRSIFWSRFMVNVRDRAWFMLG